MKKILFSSIVYSLLFILAATLDGAPNSKPDFDVEITIKGLVCPSYAIGLKNIFGENTKVKSLKMDYKQGNLFLDYWNVEIHPSKIKKMVKDSGYEVSSIKWLKKKRPNRYNKP